MGNWIAFAQSVKRHNKAEMENYLTWRDSSLPTRDCHKCVYEVGCRENPLFCQNYKRDAPDGGYYG